MTSLLREWKDDVIHTLLRNSTINQHQQPSPVTAYRLTYSGLQALSSRRKAKTMEGPRAGRRTIGQVAGHMIHLEIEEVSRIK